MNIQFRQEGLSSARGLVRSKRLLGISMLMLVCFVVTEVAANPCNTNTITLNSQADVDSFQSNYGPCTEVSVNLIIDGDDITNLSPLAGLVAIGDSLNILNNQQLTSLSGLENVDSVPNALRIHDNPMLESIDLTDLLTVGDGFTILRNTNLVSLQGLEKLSSVGHSLQIQDNPKLVDVELTELLTVGHDLNIMNNANLVSLHGVEKLSSVGHSLRIQNSPKLVEVELTGLLTVGRDLNIMNNAILVSLQGIEKLYSVGYTLRIQSNPRLTDVALTLLTGVESELRIIDNASLTSLFGLQTVESVGRDLIVQDNASLWQCGSIFKLVDSNDDGVAGPGTSPIPDVNEGVIIEGNLPGCNGVGEVLSVHPGVAALAFEGGSEVNIEGELTLGWSFDVLHPVLVSHLGVFDTDSQNALESTHKVGLWAPDGTLLMQTEISKTSPQSAGFRYKQIPAIALPAGENYIIGAVFDTSGLPADFPIVAASQTTVPEIAYTAAMQSGNLGFSRPELVLPDLYNDGVFGANFVVAGKQHSPISVAGGAPFSALGDLTLGWDFTVTEPTVVAQLGIYDPTPGDPLEENHMTGLWNEEGDLLASVEVSANAPLVGQIRVAAIPDLVLQPGSTYSIGAIYNTTITPSDSPIGFSSVTTLPQVQYQRSVQSGGGFSFPDIALNFEQGVFGPAFIITTGNGLVELPVFTDGFETQ